jgi:hypothetical protein
MPKSHLRWSAASGTAKRKIERLLRRGWQPGLAIGKILEDRRHKERRPQVSQEGGCHVR